MKRLLLGSFLLSGGMLMAQETELWQPEVRRAIPVQASPTPRPQPTPAQEYQNPAWMERVRPATTPDRPPPTPEPGFTPFRPQGRIEVAPESTPDVILIERAQPVDDIPVAPAVPFDAPLEVAPTPTPPPPSIPAPAQDEAGDIRLSPSSANGEAAAEAALNLANSVFARKMYDYAIEEYEKFLISYPSAKGRDAAMFRLAECHRMLGNEQPARIGYEKLLMEFREGEFAGAAAYRMGEYLLAEKKYDPAIIQFRLASTQAASDEVRLSAKFNLAQCLDRTDQKAEAAKVYAEVAAVEKNNPYRGYARMAAAEAAAKAGRKEEALESFSAIAADDSTPGPARAEAALKAAALAAELGQKEKAAKLFAQVLKMDGAGDWRSVAYLGSMRLSFDLGDYKKVAAMADDMPADLTSEAKAELLLLAANSQRQLGNTQAAQAAYNRLLTEFPDAPSSRDARFPRIVSMYQLGDPNLLKEADEFLKGQITPKERAQVSLIKAETLFKDKKYADAGPIYASLADSKELDENLRNSALFKLARCETQTKNFPGAIKTYTEYIEKNQGKDTLSQAIAQRGIAYQDNKQYAEAIKDFDLLIEKYPKASERELALQQKALILGQQKDYKGMIAAFQQLLTEYPKSEGAGQANFWIGWAAFEEKNYKEAIESLERAAKLDPPQYGERATLRVILSYYYLEDRDALVKLLAANPKITVPTEITLWLGRKAFEEGNYMKAEQYLLPVLQDPKAVNSDVLIELAEAQIKLGKYREASPQVDQYLEKAREPYSRARGLLARSGIALGQKQFDEAVKLNEEALLLQPEGRLNAEGRILSGEIAFARGDYDGASRAFMTVAVLYDDPIVTPKALRRAADAYRKMGNLLEAEKAQSEMQRRFPADKKTAKSTTE